jgi:hypothetical protein
MWKTVGVFVAVVVVGVGAAVLRKGGDSADAASHSPGVPQPAVAIWEEDFETLPYGTPPPLTSDSGKDMYGNGMGYSADPHWSPSWLTTAFCNGFIVNGNAAAGSAAGTSDNCDRIVGEDAYGRERSAWWFAQNLARALGQAQGDATPADNNAVVEMTRGNTDANGGVDDGPMPNNGNTMLRTSNLMTAAGHYYQASAWFASANCAADTGVGADAQLTVGLYANGGGTPIAVTAPTSPCSGGTRQNPDAAGTPFYTAQYATDIVQLSRELSYSSIIMELRNNQLAIAGNDSAFDLPAFHDATPQFDQAFSEPAASGGAGFRSTLTYTITNSAELAAKPSLSFSNSLPWGITPVAGSESSNCADSRVSVVGQQVNFSGALNAGDVSCTITVEVAAAQSGTYTNDVWAFADYGNTGHYLPWGLLQPEAATLTVANVAKLELTAGTDKNSVDKATENIVYSFSITNGGNAAVENLAFGYAGFSGDASSIGPMTCSETPFLGLEDLTLQAGETVECFFTYKTTQGDIDAHGGIDLTDGMVSGVVVAGGSSVRSNKESLHVAAGATPSLTLAKVAVRASGAAVDAPLVVGETVNYFFIVANTSNATVKDITIQDTAFSGSGGSSSGNLDAVCPQTVLAPFEMMRCTADYEITAADVANNSINNTANARGIGTDKTVEVVVSSVSDSAELPEAAAPGLAIANSHAPLPAGNTWAGDQLRYIITVANTGNVPLDDVQVANDVHDDGFFDMLANSDCANWPNLGRLEPGEIVVCEANYELTQKDIDQGGAISHTASATGTASGGGAVNANATDYEDAYPVTAPDLTLTRTAPSEIKDGEIEYTYNIYNNGNTTLTGVALRDEVGGGAIVPGSSVALVPNCVWPGAAGVLAPKQTATCTAAYQLTGSDILAETMIESVASVVGVDALGKIASSIATATTDIVRGEGGTISGHLYMDHNMNWHFDTANSEHEVDESRIPDTEILLTGTDKYGNAVARSVLTNERGEYVFDDLYPGTYTVIRPRNSFGHISVSSTGGYLEVNKDGNPLPNAKNGSGSAQGEAIGKDFIQQVQIGEGDHSQGNDFGETCGSIGDLIWMDYDRDGFYDEGEPGIEGVEVAVYLDYDRDGVEDEFLRTTITDANGVYYFSYLDLAYREQYLIRITDGGGTLSALGLAPTYTAVKADIELNDCSSNSEDGRAYAGTDIVLHETAAKVGWFDWMNEADSPDLTPASQPRKVARSVPPADKSVVGGNSNLTADFGFMTASADDPTVPGGDDGDDDNPNVPDTGVLFRVGDFAVSTTKCVIFGAILICIGGVAVRLRCRRHYRF